MVGIRWIAGWAVIWLGVSLSVAESHEERWRELLAGDFLGCTNIGGRLIAIEQASVFGSSQSAVHSAENRARVLAAGRFTDYSLRGVEWPEQLHPRIVAELTRSYRRLHRSSLKLRGVELLGSIQPSVSGVRVAVGLPDAEAQIPPTTLADIHRAFAEGLDRAPEDIDAFAYLEFCEPAQRPRAIQAAAESLHPFGVGAVETFRGGVLESASHLGVLWGEGCPSVDVDDLEALLQLLGQHPYNPTVCLALGKAFGTRGQIQAADIMFQRGAEVFVGLQQSRQCSKQMEDRGRTPFGGDGSPDRLLLSSLASPDSPVVKAMGPAGQGIIASGGSLPVKPSPVSGAQYDLAWEFFSKSPPDLPAALRSGLLALETHFSADAANLVGRVLMLRGMDAEAVPFLAQAFRLNEHHPYARRNLCHSLMACGQTNVALQFGALNDPTD